MHPRMFVPVKAAEYITASRLCNGTHAGSIPDYILWRPMCKYCSRLCLVTLKVRSCAHNSARPWLGSSLGQEKSSACCTLINSYALSLRGLTQRMRWKWSAFNSCWNWRRYRSMWHSSFLLLSFHLRWLSPHGGSLVCTLVQICCWHFLPQGQSMLLLRSRLWNYRLRSYRWLCTLWGILWRLISGRWEAAGSTKLGLVSPAGILKTRLRGMEQCNEEVTQLMESQGCQCNVTLIDQVRECLSLCASLRFAITKAIKAERSSEMGNWSILAPLLTLQMLLAEPLLRLLRQDHLLHLSSLDEFLLLDVLEQLLEDVQLGL